MYLMWEITCKCGEKKSHVEFSIFVGAVHRDFINMNHGEQHLEIYKIRHDSFGIV